MIVLSLSLLSSFCTATIKNKRRGDDDQEDFSSFLCRVLGFVCQSETSLVSAKYEKKKKMKPV